MSPENNHLADFGPFTFDFTTNVLLRGEERVDLPPLALAMLRYLIENRERSVPKAELQREFWEGAAAGTADSLAGSIYQQIGLIRKKLGDSDENPIIETKYKLGYRFVVPVTERGLCSSKEPATPESDPPRVTGGSGADGAIVSEISMPGRLLGHRNRILLQLSIVALFLVTTGAALAFWNGQGQVAKVTGSTQLTNDGKPKTAPILTDGKRIFFVEVSEGSHHLLSIPVSGGEPTAIPLPLPHVLLKGISRDGSTLLLQSEVHREDGKLWTYGIYSRSLRLLNTGWVDAAWSPDGRALAVTDAPGTSVRFLRGAVSRGTELPGRPSWLDWAPDGQRLRFVLNDFKYDSSMFWEIAEQSGQSHAVPSLSEGQKNVGGGVWSRDGRYFFYEAGNGRRMDIWAKRENAGFSSFAASQPSRLTTGAPGSWDAVTPAPNPSTLFAMNSQVRHELVRLDLKTGLWNPYWNGRAALELDYSRDAQWVAYTYAPDHTIWKARPDGSESVQLTDTTAVLEAHQPHWSPDGSRIAFMGRNRLGQWHVFQVSCNGGPMEELLSSGESWGVPTWSGDGRFVSFGERLSAKPRTEMALYLIKSR